MSPDNASTSAASGSGAAEANDGASAHSAENNKQPHDTTDPENNGEIAFDAESSTIILSIEKDGKPITSTTTVNDTTAKDHKRKRSNSSGTEDGEIKEIPAPNVKRAKTSRITQSLWEGFGGERDFDLKSGWLYDPKRWMYSG